MSELEKTNVREYISALEAKFETVLGTEGLKFNYFTTSKGFIIEKVEWKLRAITDKFEEALQFLMKLLPEYFTNYTSASNSLEKLFVIDNICNIFVYCLILNNMDQKTRDYRQMKKLKKFANDLNDLAAQTYEQRKCTASFILINETNEQIKTKLNDFKVDYIPFQESESIYLPNINKYSRALRLIDSLSLSYVINNDYEIIGLAKKRRSHQSIKDICINNSSNTIQFIYLEDKKIHWHLNKDRVLFFENHHWKLKDYNVIKSILKEILCITENDSQITILSNIIKDLSNNNTGALFAILDNNYHSTKKLIKYTNKNILKHMLVEEITPTAALYKKVITNKKENISINQKTDPYLIKLIADVDGAVIFNNNLNILDFGRMIQPQNIIEEDNSKRNKKIFTKEFVDLKNNKFNGDIGDSNQVSGGARSLATFHASTFGLAIKISEDGGITIYKRRQLVFKL